MHNALYMNTTKTTKERRANLTRWHKALQKEISAYMKAKRCEMRKRPVYLAKDSDKAVDTMTEAFRYFVHFTYRD